MFHVEPLQELGRISQTEKHHNWFRRQLAADICFPADEESMGFLIGWRVGSMWAGPGAAQVPRTNKL